MARSLNAATTESMKTLTLMSTVMLQGMDPQEPQDVTPWYNPRMSAPRDTSPEADERYFELLRERTPREKAIILAGLVSSVRKLALAGERDAHPELSERALEARVAARLYGENVARRFFPDVRFE